MTAPLDIVIPVYNEGGGILRVLVSLDENIKTPSRVLICYDHDDDTTLPVVTSFHATNFSIVPVKNKGKGPHGAVMTGFMVGGSEAAMLLPADDPHNTGIIDRMFDEIKNGADIVCPSRFMKGGSMVGCPIVKAVLCRVANFTLYHGAGLPTHDGTNGFRMFSRRVLDEITVESTTGFVFSLEYLVKAHERGLKVVEVPAVWIERSQGESRFRVLRWLPAYLHWYFYAFRVRLKKLFGR